MAKISGWPLGINNVAHDTALPEGSLRDAVDVDLDAAGKPRSRPGVTQVYAGTDCHSVFKYEDTILFVEGTDLKRLLPNNSATVVQSGLAAHQHVSYAVVNGEVFWSNNSERGIVPQTGVHREWGLPNPGGQPLLSVAAFGALPAGKYQLAMTFEGANGEESGASLAAVFDLASKGGIQLESIPQGNLIAYAVIYMTEANGKVMRQVARIPTGVTSYTISNPAWGKPLETQFMWRMPVGHLVRHDHGRMWVAIGRQVWYSEPLRYGLCRPAENFFQFPEDVTIMEMTDDGIYVVADQTYFLPGNDPEKMTQLVVSPYRGIPGTGVSVPASVFNLEGVTGDVAYWFSEKGAMLGLPGGNVQVLMEDRVALPEYYSGTSTFKEVDGIRHLLTALAGGGDASNFGVGDSLVTNIVRNGIVIN